MVTAFGEISSQSKQDKLTKDSCLFTIKNPPTTKINENSAAPHVQSPHQSLYSILLEFIFIFSSRPEDEHHPSVKPDGYVNNLAEAVDLILKYN